jgi:hypothetical protein
MAAGPKKPAPGGKGKETKEGAAKKPGAVAGGWYVLLLAAVVAAFAFLAGVEYGQVRAGRAQPADAVPASTASGRPLDEPVRAAPARFPADSSLPDGKELLASGPVDPAHFSPGRDLLRFEDPRVWFESDQGGYEDDDHTMHRCLKDPLCRLVTLAQQRHAQIRVYDAYRPAGIHRTNSLHREGRALDLAADGLSLEDLAKLCWQSGFDWVFYENAAKSGAHIHCSARCSATSAPPPPVPAPAGPGAIQRPTPKLPEEP